MNPKSSLKRVYLPPQQKFMKTIFLIFTIAALLSFTVAEQFSQKGNMTEKAEQASFFANAGQQLKQLDFRSVDSVTVVPNGYTKTGNVSYYANKFHGRRTSSGAVYHKDSLTAAHKTLKFGTLLRVTNLANDSVVIVKVTDRMGKSPHVLDLSYAGAKKLDFVRNGVAKVMIEEVTR
jgi:rare lipoprotein A